MPEHIGNDGDTPLRGLDTARAMLAATHLPPTLAVTSITTALALSAGRGRRAASMGAAVLCGQATVGWSNDYLDRWRDTEAGRTDKPIVAGRVSPRLVRNGAIVAAVACVPLSLLEGWRAGCVHLVAVGAAVAYNAGLKSTVASVVPYVVAFGALPAYVSLSRPDHGWPPQWTMIAAALLGAGAHCINVLPDVEADARTDVRGLPQRLGPTIALYVGTGLLAAATIVVATSGGEQLGWVRSAQRILLATDAATLGAVVVAARRGRTRAAWITSLATAMTTVALYATKRPMGRPAS